MPNVTQSVSQDQTQDQEPKMPKPKQPRRELKTKGEKTPKASEEVTATPKKAKGPKVDPSGNPVTPRDKKGLPKVEIVPQDIARVLLNLFNNGLYSLKEKSDQKKKAKQSFEPELLITTSSDPDHVIIKVRDNGNGIPVHVKEKIFEPFFTTKPTGKGTGLGLSISYDIIKAHGGEMNFESKENEFTEFVIQLPCSV